MHDSVLLSMCISVTNRSKMFDLSLIQVLIRALTEPLALHLTNKQHRFAVEATSLFPSWNPKAETFEHIFADGTLVNG